MGKKRMSRKKRQEEESSGDEEVLPLSSEDEEENFAALEKMTNQYNAVRKGTKELVDSLGGVEEDDLEDEVDDDWGKNKSQYYMGAKDREEGDLKFAEEEEEEALKLQQQLMGAMDEEDYDMGEFEIMREIGSGKPDAASGSEETDDSEEGEKEEESEEQRTQKMIKNSPELAVIVNDIIEKKKQFEELLVMKSMVDSGAIPEGVVSNYVLNHHTIIKEYLTFADFYLLLKFSLKDVKNHPVVKTLVEYKQMLAKAEETRTKIEPMILKSLQTKQKKSRKPVPILQKRKRDVKAKREKTMAEKLDSDEEDDDADPDFRDVSAPKRVSFAKMADEVSADEEGPVEKRQKRGEGVDDEEEPYVRRRVSAMIMKNKGLTPQRSRKHGNPRIKNKAKFKRAEKRHRSQVAPLRKETTRYGGEARGIKIGTVKSVQFK